MLATPYRTGMVTWTSMAAATHLTWPTRCCDAIGKESPGFVFSRVVLIFSRLSPQRLAGAASGIFDVAVDWKCVDPP